MREQIFGVGDLLEHAEHDDDVGVGRGLGREIAAGEIAGALPSQATQSRP